MTDVKPRDIVNVIVEDILRPNMRHPYVRDRKKDKNFIYSDRPGDGDEGPKIGVFHNNTTALEQKSLNTLDKYEQDRIRAGVQMRSDLGQKDIEQNFDFPDGEGVNKAEDAIGYLAERVKNLVEADMAKSKSNSKIRSLGGSDEDVVLEYDTTTPFYPTTSIKRLQVDFLVVRE